MASNGSSVHTENLANENGEENSLQKAEEVDDVSVSLSKIK